MPQTGVVTLNYQIGGTQFASSETKTAEGAISHVIDLPAGVAGVMQTAPNIDGLEAGNSLAAGDAIDIHWDDPTDGTHKVSLNQRIETDNDIDIVLDEAAPPTPFGDSLPPSGTPVVVSTHVVVDTDFDGDKLEIIAMKSDVRCMVDVRTSTAEEAGSLQAQKLAKGASWFWLKGFGFTNPFASATVDVAHVTNGSTTAGVVFLALLYQSV